MSPEDVLMGFYGVGPVIVKKLLKKINPKNLETRELARKALRKPEIFKTLPLSTQADVIYNPDRQIPRAVISFLEKSIQTNFKKKHKLCGSYRRKKLFSGDVDLVITSTWDKFNSDMLKSNISIKKPYAIGPDRVSTIIAISMTSTQQKKLNLSKRNWKIKMDVFITNKYSYPFAILYATGSGEYNILMRAKAKRRGMLLNQHGLYKNGKSISVSTEQDIFRLLDIPFKKPENRFIKSKQ